MRQILWVWLLLMMAFASINIERYHCCLEEERTGLLEIKAWFNPPYGTSLPDWVENTGDTDCCEWDGVECDDTTNRVTELNLSSERYYLFSEDLCLNASLFLAFKELKSLELDHNTLVGCSENQGFEILASRLKKLEILDLSSNTFNDSILTSLSVLSSLKILNLSDNKLTTISTDIHGLQKLEFLDLSYNNFNDSVLASLSGLSSLKTLDLSDNKLMGSMVVKGLKNLKILHLDGIDFKESVLIESLGALPSLTTFSAIGSKLNRTLVGKGIYNLTNLEELYLSFLPTNFLQNIGHLSTLRILSLTSCDLTLPAQGLCELKNLRQLHLSSNKLEGFLPPCFTNLSSLQLLDVSHNHLDGNIGSSALTNLTSLKYLDLSSNRFEVPTSFKSFVNHSNLKFLSCDDNKLITEPFFRSIIPKFQLQFFTWRNCRSKSAEIPNFLHSQYDLRFLDLSRSNLKGMFPSWLFKNNTRLEQVFLRDNFFRGPLQFQYHPNPDLSILNIANNNMSGQIPRNICLTFPNLDILNMTTNRLEGGTPSCFGNMSNLDILDLSNNALSAVKLEQLTSLSVLVLSNNNLEGHISPSVFNSSSLYLLYLNGNNLTGQVWDISQVNGLFLNDLDISDNRLSGMLPKWIGKMSYLWAIDLSKNHFKGPIPGEFCNLSSLEYFDLSYNSLSGFIPSCFNPPRITHIHLSNNQLSGLLTFPFFNISTLVTLDLSNNSFTGPIPNWIGNLSNLSVLVLKANAFGGELPIQLCKLEQLSILDVSKNKLSGSLPSCFGNLTFKAASKKRYHRHQGWVTLGYFPKSYFVSMGLLNLDDYISGNQSPTTSGVDEGVEFTTKNHSYIYKGDILNFMSGMDLSCNRFSGDIPSELGKLDGLRALNLSHNNFNGSLPATFSKLNQIESLDLSHNSLTGNIPPQLNVITTLEVFSVAYNNLSGATPERKNQFGTFDESSYEGNPLLCGPPLQTNCTKEESPSQSTLNDEEEHDDSIDLDVFYVSFVVCYIIVVLTIAVVLYINPYWRRRWFYFIEECIDTCYYFVMDRLHTLSTFRRS